MAAILAVCACSLAHGRSWVIEGVRTPLRSNAAVLRMAIPHFVTEDKVKELAEAAAVKMLGSIETVPITLPSSLATGPVTATFVRTGASPGEVSPLVVIHGFDSSCLEFRRLMPELEQRGIEAYAYDVFGWSATPTATAPSTDDLDNPLDGAACLPAQPAHSERACVSICPALTRQCFSGGSPTRAPPAL
jgi:hypothetical protein